MQKTITEPNLRLLIDTLVSEGKRVIGPKAAGTMTLYEPLSQGEELNLGELPRRSAKEAFFPLCETILTYERDKEGVRVTDVDPQAIPETVLVAARPCDVAAAPVLDSVFSWDFKDEFFLERRRKTTIIGLACARADDACFCTAVGLSPGDTKGSDLFLAPLTDGGYRCDAITEKGEALLAAHADLFSDAATAEPLPLAEPTLGKLDLEKIRQWLDTHFEDPLWEEIAARCAGCGACAFLCPACHCFDIVDEGGEEKGARRKSWDACGFGKFTNHASGHNPRDVQPSRYRNRIMHKFKYYVDKFDQRLCTGCGRCVRACPVGIDIATVLEEINSK
ncbi:4Fe-4S dicluster domain-containing protein [Geobacter pickeringii]|uniref:Heterodisulfide reductase subunit A n=1 Tax=Geobacter pickeringii TaxID=345632 RepID=A0A0B5BKM8_9BACT|nr:4Fe-4S dicluster domain-containing protein [Geobacter pickeringii]AJE03110.1 heterodisulfide reductase subunit A [Geobacter pickeringii]AJE04621.1 heterodisulfide reductase subunit A [Geobacter pickeringii]